MITRCWLNVDIIVFEAGPTLNQHWVNSVKQMTSTSFVFTELANTMKYGGGFLYNLFSPSDVTAFHRMKYGGGGVI